jgi:hypothetical protein
VIGKAAVATGRTYIGIERETTAFLTVMNSIDEERMWFKEIATTG